MAIFKCDVCFCRCEIKSAGELVCPVCHVRHSAESVVDTVKTNVSLVRLLNEIINSSEKTFVATVFSSVKKLEKQNNKNHNDAVKNEEAVHQSNADENKITPATPEEIAKNYISDGFKQLKNGCFDLALECFNSAKDITPDDAEIYFGLLMIDYKVPEREALGKLSRTFDNNKNFKRTIDCGNFNLNQELYGYLNEIAERKRNTSLEGEYKSATRILNRAQIEGDFLKAAEIFARIRDYKDAEDKAVYCYEQAETVRKDHLYNSAVYKALPYLEPGAFISPSVDRANLMDAIYILNQISEWRDANIYLNRCYNVLKELDEAIKDEELRRKQVYDARVKKEKQKSRVVRIIITIILLLISSVILYIALDRFVLNDGSNPVFISSVKSAVALQSESSTIFHIFFDYSYFL